MKNNLQALKNAKNYTITKGNRTGKEGDFSSQKKADQDERPLGRL